MQTLSLSEGVTITSNAVTRTEFDTLIATTQELASKVEAKERQEFNRYWSSQNIHTQDQIDLMWERQKG